MQAMRNKIFKRLSVVIIAITVFIGASSFRTDFFEIAKQLEIFTTLFKELNMNYVDETNPAELMDTAIKAMLTDLDPYTNYYNEQDVEAARMNTAGEYQGIGAARIATFHCHLQRREAGCLLADRNCR